MRKLLAYVAIILITVVFLGPVAYNVSKSLMPATQAMADDLVMVPSKLTLAQYEDIILFKNDFFANYWNSVIITVAIIVGQLVIALLAAYAYAFIPEFWRKVVLAMYVILAIIPYQVTNTGNYILFEKFTFYSGVPIVDSHLSLILPGIFSAISVFIMAYYIRSIDFSVIEAGQIDGAGHWKMLRHIIIPQIFPAMLTVAFLTFVDVWNQIEQAVIFIKSKELMPLSAFIDQVYLSEKAIYYAGSLLYLIPGLFMISKLYPVLKKLTIETGGEK